MKHNDADSSTFYKAEVALKNYLKKGKLRKEYIMTVVKNSDENREKLARDMVDSWDDKDLYEFAVDKVDDGLVHYDDEVFDGEWKHFYGEDA